MAPAGLEEEEQQRHDEDITRGAAVSGQACGEVPQEPVDDGAEARDGDLGDDAGGAEGDPVVDPRGVLAALPQREVLVEFWDDGVDDGGRDEYDEEGGEDTVLHVENGVAELIKCKSVENADDDGDEEFAVEVGWGTPVLSEHSTCQHCNLQPH